MSAVEDKVVEMKFTNSGFMQGAQQVLGMMDKLKSSLSFGKGTVNGIDEVQKSASRFSLQGILGATAGVQAAFAAMATVGITALTNITNRAVDAGIQMAKSLTIDPVSSGLSEYETNMNSIQTILANTQFEGAGLEDVNGALDELNHYADQTIYNFSEMARNIGTFTAAGVQLGPATESIKGIANLAALSGSSSTQASTAMYQLSQAIAAGRVSLQDWNSVVNAGMGGATFQRALATTAGNMGTLAEGALKVDEATGRATINGQSFRDSISASGGEPSWLTSDVLTKTLSQFTGDLTDAELAAQGFNAEQIKSIQATAATAQDAATQVKTLSQVFDVAKESVGSGWAKTFQLIFGDFEQAKSTFTAMSNVINGFITKSSSARNKLLESFNAIGGRRQLIALVTDAFKALQSILKPIGEAFRKVFPPASAMGLLEIVVSLRRFIQSLTLSGETAKNLKRTLAGVFAVASIGFQVFKGIIGVLFDVIGSLSGAGGGFLEFTGNIGKFLVEIDKAIKRGDGLTKFFDGLSSVITAPIKFIVTLVGALFDIGAGVASAEGGLGRVTDRLSFFGDGLNSIKGAFQGVANFFDSFSDRITNLAPALAGLSQGISDAIAGVLAGGDYSSAFDTLNTALFGGIVLLIKRFFDNGFKIDLGGGGDGLFASITDTFGALTGTLEAMQSSIQAKTILTIAIAIAVLTASIVALSLIDSKALNKALIAITAGFAQLLGAMAILTKVTSSAGFVKIPAIATAMVLLGTSILILSLAVKVLSSMTWGELIKGLAGVGALLLGLVVAAKLMSGVSGGLLRAGLAMVPLAIGINLLAIAVKQFANMSWGEMLQGLVGVAGALVAVAVGMRLMPKTLPLTAAGLLLVAVALNGLGLAMKLFASMSWEEMGKGMAGIAGGLILIAAGMNAMPLTLPITAAGLILVAVALEALAGVAKTFATMSYEDMGKAAVAIGGAMVILAAGLYLMSGTGLGSVALLAAAAALVVLTPVLLALSSMDIASIATALGFLAGVFAVLGIAGLLLTPVILPILGLSVALLAIGAGVALAGAGLLAIATAFGIFVAAATAAVIVVSTIQNRIASFAVTVAESIIAFVMSLANGSGQMIAAFMKILTGLLQAAAQQLPKIGRFFSQMITTALGVVRRAVPQFITTGVAVILALLGGITKHAGKIADAGADALISMIRAVSRQAPRLADEGVKAIISFVNAIALAIRANRSEMNAAGVNVASAIVEGMVSGIAGGIRAVTDAAKRLAHSALDAAKSALGIKSPSKEFKKVGQFVHEGFAEGLGSSEDTKAAIENFKQLLKDGISGARDTIKSEKEKLNKLLKAKKKDPEAIKKARENIKQAQREEKALQQSQNLLTKGLKQRGAELTQLGKDFDAKAADLAAKQERLKALQDELLAYKNSQNDMYKATPTIDTSTSVNAYIRQLSTSVTKINEMRSGLEQLRGLGLDDTTYKKLADQGVDALPFIKRLIAAGPSAVNQINSIDSQLNTAADQMSTSTSESLYRVGVNAQQSLVDSLASDLEGIEAAMEKIGAAMIKGIKKKLKIKSPSREFAKIGEFSSMGLANGLLAYSGVVNKAAEDVGAGSLATLKASMVKLGNEVSLPTDFNPSITPVLDLSKLQKDADKMNTMLETVPISVDASLAQASELLARSQEAKRARDAVYTTTPAPVERQVVFEQTNNSPKALSPIELYRQTNNLVSFAKEALKTL